MKMLVTISRFVLAAIFLFSGFVKGVDPLGTAYKIEDYLLAYQLDWALDLSLILSFALNALELTLGILLLFNLLPKITNWILVILMFIFTFVTLYDALYNPVPDCGCFGDAFILSNWQTFYKNIFIDLLIVTLFFLPPKKINLAKHFGIGLAIYFIFLSFSFYNLQHLPLIDFRFWKVGNQVYNTDRNAVELYVTYENKTTGEKQEYLSSNFPYQDSVWLANWKFVSSREYSPNNTLQSLMLFDREGIDATYEVLGFETKSLLIISHNLDAISAQKAKKIETIIELAYEESIPISIVTASVGNTIIDFINNYQINVPVFLADDIDLKTIVRSNPGLILLDNGKVIKKWAFADWPSSPIQIPN